jgi:hypothetical protein
MRATLPLVLIAAVAACSHDSTAPNPIPANAIVYQMDARYLRYHYIDTTRGQHYELTWLPPTPTTAFVGYNCLGFVPNAPTDTTGNFYFYYSGPNLGRIERLDQGILDTTTGYFLPPQGSDEGTRGTYATDSSNRLHLVWADGIQSRYFDAGASLQFSADTLFSSIDLSASADSIHVLWRVAWIQKENCAL